MVASKQKTRESKNYNVNTEDYFLVFNDNDVSSETCLVDM